MSTKTNKPKSPNRRPYGKGKDSYINIRANSRVKADLKARAEACGMYLGDYILSRCCGYEPKAAMTAEQEQKLDALIAVRNDIKNYSNALNGMSNGAKKIVFGNEDFMRNWKADVDKQRAVLNDIINSFINPN